MEKPFDFEKIGKKMPYSVPEGFFDRMEENIHSALSETNTHPLSSTVKNKHLKRIYLLTGAVAAVALLLLTLRIFLSNPSASEYSFEKVELAFNNLSIDDQDFLMEIYEDDVFMAVDN